MNCNCGESTCTMEFIHDEEIGCLAISECGETISCCNEEHITDEWKNLKWNNKENIIYEPILVIVSNKFFEILTPLQEYGDSLFEGWLEDYDDGLYKIVIRKISHESAQIGEYGRVEIPSCDIIDDCDVIKICDIQSYCTINEQKDILHKQQLQKFKELQIQVEKLDLIEGKRYILHSPWGFNLCLAENTSVIGDSFFTFRSIKQYSLDISDENLLLIQQDIELLQQSSGNESVLKH